MEKVLKKISASIAAETCNLSERTIRDWRREKFLMQKNAMLKLCELANIAEPKNFKEKNDYWYVSKGAKIGGRLGGLACIKKYGCVGGPKRKEKWYEWWNTKGKFNNNLLFRKKPINKPRKSKELAEFFGIMLGDGHVPIFGSQIQIAVNKTDDAKYLKFICGFVKKLFGRKPGVYNRILQNASVISFSSVDLISYLLRLGLKRGNKVKLQIDIPKWIKRDLELSKACIRGLVDTDGCIFTESHKINGKLYNYKRLNFSNRSLNLLKSVFIVFKKLGLNPKMKRYCVQIEDQQGIKKYFEIIGTHNPKHLKRYKD